MIMIKNILCALNPPSSYTHKLEVIYPYNSLLMYLYPQLFDAIIPNINI